MTGILDTFGYGGTLLRVRNQSFSPTPDPYSPLRASGRAGWLFSSYRWLITALRPDSPRGQHIFNNMDRHILLHQESSVE